MMFLSRKMDAKTWPKYPGLWQTSKPSWQKEDRNWPQLNGALDWRGWWCRSHNAIPVKYFVKPSLHTEYFVSRAITFWKELKWRAKKLFCSHWEYGSPWLCLHSCQGWTWVGDALNLNVIITQMNDLSTNSSRSLPRPHMFTFHGHSILIALLAYLLIGQSTVNPHKGRKKFIKIGTWSIFAKLKNMPILTLWICLAWNYQTAINSYPGWIQNILCVNWALFFCSLSY